MSEFDAKELKDVIQNSIESGVNAVEEIHKTIANAPWDFLSSVEMFAETAESAKEMQETLIGHIYEIIRSINHTVGHFLDELVANTTELVKPEAE